MRNVTSKNVHVGKPGRRDSRQSSKEYDEESDNYASDWRSSESGLGIYHLNVARTHGHPGVAAIHGPLGVGPMVSKREMISGHLEDLKSTQRIIWKPTKAFMICWILAQTTRCTRYVKGISNAIRKLVKVWG
jgi:hypothetical protein